MYNEIANEISGMIPVQWEQVFTIAYVTDQAGEVIFLIILNQVVMN